MKCLRLWVALPACLLLTVVGLADDSPSLITASGIVDKVGKDSLSIRPRGPDGKFEKGLVLKLTGTSKITTVTIEKRGNKSVPVQKDTEAKELKAKQAVTVIYTSSPDGLVLLTAVVLPAGEK
jgi:hypothetical protein